MANTDLYSRLKRLFSTSAVVRHVGGKKLKVVDTDHIQASMSNAMRERYSRVFTGSGYGNASSAAYSMNMAFQSQRIMLFRDYELMDQDPIISNACDIYAEESTTRNEYGKVLTIECDDENIKAILENLYYDILNIEFNLYMWVRSLTKYGDFFLFLEINPEYGIYNVVPLSVYDTVRIEGTNVTNPEYIFFETMGATGRKTRLENFQVAHFRLLGDANFLPYGRAMLEGARRVYRQLILSEDAMLIHRIMRAPEKRVFKIDIANIPPAEVDGFMQKMADKQKKIPFMDSVSGEYNLQYNMQNILEDFYIPVRGGDTGTDIQNLGGLEYNAIDDIEYLRNKLMAALKIPKAFLGYDEAVGKLTLAAEDIRFARTIERIQRIVESELYKIGVVHLFAQGHTDEELTSFKISLTTPSTIYEQEKINLWKEKVELAKSIIESNLFSTNWIYENVFEITPDIYQREKELIILDVKRMYRVEQIKAGASDPQKFGFPQDKPAPALPPGQEPGASPAGGAPTNAPPAQPAQAAPAQESKEDGRGRPEKGISYNQDSHPHGRDVLGGKEMYHVINQKQDRKQRRKFPLALESIFREMDKKLIPETTFEILNENGSLEGTYMDERALKLPKNENE